MIKDHNGDKPFRRAILRDRNGDLTKEWYVEYYAWDEVLDGLVRKRIKVSMSFQTKKARVHEANKIIADTNELLEKGYYFKREVVSDETSILTECENDLVRCLDKVLSIINTTLKPKSVGTYQSAINKLKDYAGEHILIIQEFTDKDVIKFRDHLLTTLGNTSRTANNTIIHLNTLYRYLKDRVTIPVNSFKTRKLKQAVTTKNIAFTDRDREAVGRYFSFLLLHRTCLYRCLQDGPL
ncbi:phage integrase SAM-like domain-containing protein [Dyadobacter frigoris]|nr:site-specific integrase [Dyadobacter frigoris]